MARDATTGSSSSTTSLPPALPTAAAAAKRGDIADVEVPRTEGGRVCGNQAYVTLVGHRLRYWVRWASGPNGPEVIELHIDQPNSTHADSQQDSEPGPAIVAADLRSIPLRKIAAAAARACGEEFMAHHVGRPSTPGAIRFFSPDPKAEAGPGVTWGDLLYTPEPSAGRRRDLTDDHLQQVAQLARAAFHNGHKVRDTLADHYAVSVYTIDKWLAAARYRNILTPGELTKHRRQ